MPSDSANARSAAYKVDSVEGCVRNLRDLLSVMCEVAFETPADERDSRIDSLLWIARDLAEGLAEQVEMPREERERLRRAYEGSPR